MRSEGYGSRCVDLSVCLSVCLSVSVKSHLTSGASVRREIAATHSAGNEGQIFVAFSLKLLRCRDRELPPLDGHTKIGHFPADNTHVHCAHASLGVLL